MYHYHPLDHALQPLPAMALDALARTAVAWQHWFADAPVLVVMAPRYARVYLEVPPPSQGLPGIAAGIGHLSQLLYLCATQA